MVLTNYRKWFFKWVGQTRLFGLKYRRNGSRRWQHKTQDFKHLWSVSNKKKHREGSFSQFCTVWRYLAPTAWIWRTGVFCAERQIDNSKIVMCHAQPMPRISFLVYEFLPSPDPLSSSTPPFLRPPSPRVCCHKSHTPHHSHNSDGAKHPETEEEIRAASRQLVHRWPWTWSVWRRLTLFCTLPPVTTLHYRGREQ